MDEIKGIARVKFHPGKVDEWKRLTEQAMEVVRTKDRDAQRVILTGWVDPAGNVRMLSDPPGTGRTEGPLPVFVYNR